tara:strand:+ start:809 stop:1180 length:372 start_codon:yes stop_codon:yes gene_type:complete
MGYTEITDEQKQKAHEDYFNEMRKEEVEQESIMRRALSFVKLKVSNEFYKEVLIVINDDLEHTWNFKITEEAKGDYETQTELPNIKGYYVNQTTDGGFTGDEFAGTIAIEFEKGKYLEWEYSC